jgi:capsular polysaccharide biosynthesis protein
VEIRDYLTIVGRRVWIAALVPLLAGCVVTALVLRQPPQYRATATVAAPGAVGGDTATQYGGANGPKLFVADFSAALRSPVVVRQVSRQTGVQPQELVDGLSATPLGESSMIQLTFTTPKARLAGPVVAATASDSIRFLFQAQVTFAQQAVEQARKAVAAADADLTAFYRQTGLVEPEQSYQIKAQQIADLQRQQLNNQVAGETDAAAKVGGAIKAAKAELAALAPNVTRHQTLVARRQQAADRLAGLDQQAERVSAQFEAVKPTRVVLVGDVERVSKLADVVRKGGAAFGAGLFLAVGIIVLLELLRRRPRPVPTDGGGPLTASELLVRVGEAMQLSNAVSAGAARRGHSGSGGDQEE